MSLENELRSKLLKFPVSNDDTFWGSRRRKIRATMVKENDWSSFLKWPIVIASLFSGRTNNSDSELKELKNTKWIQILNELGFIPDNGTAIHQVNLLHWGGNFRSNWTIAEFGGGYGELYRLITQYGHTGNYYVYDFPELLILQEYYLRSNNVSLARWNPCYSKSDWLKATGSELLVSVCAISEAPIEDRKIFWEISPKFVLLRYQPVWDKINNDEYFRNHGKKDLEIRRVPGFPHHLMMLIKMD